MIEPRMICTVCILILLIACDDQEANSTRPTQQQLSDNNTQTLHAIEQVKARLAINPKDFESLSILGDLYFESGRYIDAFNVYDKALAVNPKCADCYNDRGLSLFYLGDPTSALESFDKAILLDPGFTHAWLSKGFVLTSEGRYHEAVVPLEKVKELDGSGPLAIQADKFLALAAEKSLQ